MKIILKEDITNLGYKDDVVEVKSGYGRNYLIPQGKAVIATPSALKVLAENQRQRAHKLAKIKADAGRFIRAISIQFLRMVFVEFSNLAIYGNRYRLHKVTSIMIHKIILLNAPAPEFSSSIACKII